MIAVGTVSTNRAAIAANAKVRKNGYMSSQPQLLPISLDPSDVVYTPSWLAQDMVEFFNPVGSILEPCAGDGVFLNFLPSAQWCEIEKGRDFFAWNTPIDWMIGNPPFSMLAKWIYHSMEFAENIVYIVPCRTPFISNKMVLKMYEWGSVKHMRIYGQGNQLNFPLNYLMAALHFQRGYHGAMEMSYHPAILSNNA